MRHCSCRRKWMPCRCRLRPRPGHRPAPERPPPQCLPKVMHVRTAPRDDDRYYGHVCQPLERADPKSHFIAHTAAFLFMHRRQRIMSKPDAYRDGQWAWPLARLVPRPADPPVAPAAYTQSIQAGGVRAGPPLRTLHRGGIFRLISFHATS